MMNKLIINDDIVDIKCDSSITITKEKEKLLDIITIKITVHKNSDLIIDFSSKKNIKTDISVDILKDVNLNIYEIKKCHDSKSKYKINIEKNSYLNFEKIVDTKENKEMSEINLNGENAKIDFKLKTICTKEEKYNFLVYHNAKRTISNINNNGINILNGTLEFNVSSFVPKNIIKCDVNQSGRIINIKEGKCIIKPNLFIDEEDVTANHSALIGTFSKDETFYLMSRGISAKEALKILSKGFLMKGITHHKEEMLKIIDKYWR